MTNVKLAMEYAAKIEREAIKNGTSLGAAFDAAYADYNFDMQEKAYYENRAERHTKALGESMKQTISEQHMREEQEKVMQQTEKQEYMREQNEKKAYYRNVAQREDMMPPTPTSPIRTALTLLDTRLSDLQATVERLFSALRPVTTNTDDNRPGEPAVAREGNSPLNIDINAMADRLGAITVALQLQVDRLEV